MTKIEELKQKAILDVAQSLGLELRRQGSDRYVWAEHDSLTITPSKNMFSWWSRDMAGDVITFVQAIREYQTGQMISFKEAAIFLEKGEFPIYQPSQEPVKPFSYYLASSEQAGFREARQYLREERGLSDETIDTFRRAGGLAQARLKTDDYSEPVVVFKSLEQGKVVGASLQGIIHNPDRYDRGRLKKIIRASDGLTGFSLDIGQPKRLVFAESAIDLMSYYEYHKEKLSDVRLVAMEGLKEGVVSRHVMTLQAERQGTIYEVDHVKTPKALRQLSQLSDFFMEGKNDQLITLAVDNDEAGRRFINKLRDRGIGLTVDLPPLSDGQDKMDWNDYLKQSKLKEKTMSELQLEQQVVIRPDAQALIDEGSLFQWRKQPNLYFVKGMRRVAFELTTEGSFKVSDRYPPKTEEEREMVEQLLDKQNGTQKALDSESQGLSNGGEFHRTSDYLEVTTSGTASQPVVEEPQPKFPATTPLDFTRKEDILQAKKAETKLGDFPDEQGAAPLPETTQSQPLNDLSPNQTRSQPLLHFTIKEGVKSIHKDYYHSATPKDIVKLNRYAPTIQQTAQWYLDNVADSKIIYFYQDEKDISSLAVQFDKDKFMHLTGIFPYREGQTAEQTLLDFAGGYGEYDSILIANRGATFDKIKVLPELEAITESDSFYFGDLSEVPKLHQLNLDKAIKSGDEDIVLAMRTVDGTPFPASLMKLRQSLKLQLENSNEERVILGVYRERDGKIEQLSVNEAYIKDGGREMMSILENQQYERHQVSITEDKQLTIHDETVSKPQKLMEQITSLFKRDKQDKEQAVASQLLEEKDKVSESMALDEEKVTPLEKSSDRTTRVAELLAAKDTKGLSQHLKEGIKDYLDSDQYKSFLTAMSKFHHYSPRNVSLLLRQNPEVSAVASFKKWKDDFGRSVNKGEKALKVVAPVTVIKKDEQGKPILDEHNKPVTQVYYKYVPVFDVSQTSGRELPRAINELEGSYEDYLQLYQATKLTAKEKGVGVSFDTSLEKARGYYAPASHQIVLRAGMSEQATLKTFFHELAHATLHHEKSELASLTRSSQELQAESVAYVMASHYGFDTSEYSFGYLASWSPDKETLAELEAQLEIVQRTANDLIKRIDEVLEKQKSQTLKQDKFQERLATSKAKSEKSQSKESEVVTEKKYQAEEQREVTIQTK